MVKTVAVTVTVGLVALGTTASPAGGCDVGVAAMVL
jgi:hypothetical protein